MIMAWIKGIFIHRFGRIIGTSLGVAITISLIASIGIFISQSNSTMAKRAVSTVPIDWQIQVAAGTDINTVKSAVGETAKFAKMEQVSYADISGFESTTGGSVQTTGAGKILGISDTYFQSFPAELRSLLGSTSGVLIAQQTAANLHAAVGDEITVKRIGLPDVKLKVDGVIDLPDADALFQGIGLPSNAAPQAPPDNVALIPETTWHQLFDDQARISPDSVKLQLHVKLNENIPADPVPAYTFVSAKANNLEARIAGNGIVGDNLAAKLSAVREDSSYAKVLFLFLGFPGILLSMILTIIIAASGVKHRKQEQSILRIQGASVRQAIRLESLESVIVALLGVVLGIAFTVLTVIFMISDVSLNDINTISWIVLGSAVGLALSAAAVLLPIWSGIKYVKTTQIKKENTTKRPLWQKLYLDIALLIVSGAVYWQTASTGYQVVLAPEGVSAVSVNYFAFIAPFCLWIGAVLLAVRICRLLLTNGRNLMTSVLRPIAKNLSGAVSSSMSRENGFILRGVVLVSLAVSFAVSTSVFNSTYNAQAKVDAQLTNGSDVTVTSTTGFAANDPAISKLSQIPGVAACEAMQHRFAYVGNDLQDIYGIDPIRISNATAMSNAYFANNSADAVLKMLANTEDGVLVSQETVNDYQLNLGDTINLRLQNASDHSYHIVTFHFIGVVREFPTAPLDSFLVANESYISKMTGNSSSEVLLMKVTGDTQAVAKKVTEIVGAIGVNVSDLGSAQRIINSSLTSVDLRGLSALELLYAVLLVLVSVGLLFGLGLTERKRNFAILNALGAKDRQIGVFIWSEGLFVLIFGAVIGGSLGIGIAQILVKVLTGVFDPPPEMLVVPWNYLITLLLASVISTVLVVLSVSRIAKRPPVGELKNI